MILQKKDGTKVKERYSQLVPCPHCGQPINPAIMMNAQRMKRTTKKQRKEISQNALRARWGKARKLLTDKA